ncbi:hypothetical protein RSOLAG1IB_06723 [Rhizoctonia solani AG-1 IB]|uniref:Uncharacterized protein n=1 Tax=Thanatephorus cucumeris (strain AG1-IB / isolate 7/3/14) TaxID=1108050 RepID=A0A0B7F8Q8_THACB|nr:hypothetical protein RSOLAG1IB_06723 [Rhizoctonia solani AG-1 IB]
MSAPSMSVIGGPVATDMKPVGRRDSVLADGSIPDNVVAINHDLSLRLSQAPNDLREAYARDGYGGAVRFHARWIELVETVLRIHSFRLLLSSTRARALSSCDACLKLGVPVDDIWIEAMRLRALLKIKAISCAEIDRVDLCQGSGTKSTP